MKVKLGHSGFLKCVFSVSHPFLISGVSRILLGGETVLACLFTLAIQQTKYPMVYFDIQMHGLIGKHN